MSSEEVNKINGKVLEWKNQDPFFIDYYRYRDECITSKAKILIHDTKSIIISLSKFIDHTSEYLTDYIEMSKELKKLANRSREEDTKDFLCEVNNFWKKINEDHVENELIPKPNKRNIDPEHQLWKSETDSARRNEIKALVDMALSWK